MAGAASRHPIAVKTNLSLAGGLILLMLFQYFALPLWLLPRDADWGWLLLPIALTTTTYWALVHEAFHNALHPNPHVNTALGRLMAVLFAAPYWPLRFGHLSHHALNGKPSDRPDLYDPHRRSLGWARFLFYLRLFIALYAVELAASFLSFLPRRRVERVVRKIYYEGNPDARRLPDLAVKHLMEPTRMRQIRIDGAMIWIVLIGAFVCYGWNGWMLLLALLGRGLLISFMDNALHYGGPVADVQHAFNGWLPRWAGPLVLHFNLHRTHHARPNLPWSALPGAFVAERQRFDGHFLILPLRQLRGPIPYDPRSGRISAK